MGDSPFQNKNLICVVTCKMCLFSLYFVKYMKGIMEELESLLYIDLH